MTAMTLPAWVAPQLATLVAEPSGGADWVHEMKLDGYRILLRIERGRVKLLTRNRQDWTDRFPTVASRPGSRLPPSRRIARSPTWRSTRSSSTGAICGASRYSSGSRAWPGSSKGVAAGCATRRTSDEPGQEVYDRACRMALEGIVSKRKEAPYTSGRGARLMHQRVNTYIEFLDHQVKATGAVTWVEQPGLGRLPVPNVPGLLPLVIGTPRAVAPSLDQHRKEILAELGWGSAVGGRSAPAGSPSGCRASSSCPAITQNP
jgi:hypothetical protein